MPICAGLGGADAVVVLCRSVLLEGMSRCWSAVSPAWQVFRPRRPIDRLLRSDVVVVPGILRAADAFDDLIAEQDRLETILTAFDGATWASKSDAPSWTIADVVLVLAQAEEAVVPTVSAGGEADGGESHW